MSESPKDNQPRQSAPQTEKPKAPITRPARAESIVEARYRKDGKEKQPLSALGIAKDLMRRLKQHFRGELPCDEELAGLNEAEEPTILHDIQTRLESENPIDWE